MPYTYFKYYQNVTDDSKNAVKSTLQKFKNKINKNKSFLNGFTIHVVDSYNDLDKNSNLTKYVQKHSNEFFATGGMTTSIVSNKGKKEIIINVDNYGISSIWSENKSSSSISQALMHEVGHQFDNYFGKCDKNLLEKAKKLPFCTTNKEDDKILTEYLQTKDLSDTKEFKAAWKKDVEKLNECSFFENLFNNLPFEYTPYEIDITDGVIDEEVDKSDTARSEIFAQLFSYAFGEDDGQKDLITKKYKNSYTLVKSYISNLLGIDFN